MKDTKPPPNVCAGCAEPAIPGMRQCATCAEITAENVEKLLSRLVDDATRETEL